ncbi:hypothetical protein BH09MYX1_BH09MYX1_30610 [soil metagenome]
MTEVSAEIARRFPRLRVSEDAADRVAYSRDLWPRHHLAVRSGTVGTYSPSVIVWPETPDEVSELLRFAGPRGIPVVPFGAGSGVCAGVLPTSETIVIDVKRMAKMRAVDVEGKTVTVEAGYMGVPFE